MQKLIPLIYFYIVSLVGLGILIVGIFASVYVLVNIFSYAEYPLSYDTSQRCIVPQPIPLMKGAGGQSSGSGVMQPVPTGSSMPTSMPLYMPPPNNNYYQQCLMQVAQERKQAEVQDVEKAISYTLVGLLVFSVHFYFARKKSA